MAEPWTLEQWCPSLELWALPTGSSPTRALGCRRPPSAPSAPGVPFSAARLLHLFCNSVFVFTIHPPCLAAPLLRFILSLVHRLTLLPALLNQRSRSPPALGSPQAQSQVRCGARNQPCGVRVGA